MGAVNFVGQIFKIAGLASARASFDGAVDVIHRHVRRTTFEQDHAQAGIHVWVAAADLRGDRNFLAQLGKDFSAFGIQCPFEMLNLRPLAVSGHKINFVSGWLHSLQHCQCQ